MNNFVIEKNIELARDLFGGIANGIILEGSSAIGNTRNSSDVDIEIVMDDFNELKKLDGGDWFLPFKTDILRCLDCSNEKYDLIQVKHNLNGKETGFRFITRNAFEGITNERYEELDETTWLLSIRPKLREGQNGIYCQRNFFGNTISLKKSFFLRSGYQFTWIPVAIISEDGDFYPGSMLDRYLGLPRVITDTNNYISKNLMNLYGGICRRYLKELSLKKDKLESENTEHGVFHCLTRWKRYPEKIIRKIKEKENYIYKLTNKYD